MKNEKTFQAKGPENKESSNIKAEVKKILLANAKYNLSEMINEKDSDSDEEFYNPYESSDPIQSSRFLKERELRKQEKDQRLTEDIEDLKNFIQGVEELINTIDVSWIDESALTVLKKAKSSFGLDIAKLTAFLNDFRQLKQTE